MYIQFTSSIQGIVYLNIQCIEIVDVFLFHQQRLSQSSTEMFIIDREKAQTLFWKAFLLSQANVCLSLFSIKMVGTAVYD